MQAPTLNRNLHFILCAAQLRRNRTGSEDCFEYSSHQRLDKEQLAEQCKGEIEAYKLDPVCKESKNIEACIERIVEKCSDEAHCGAHQSNSSADDGSLKKDGMGLLRVKILHSQSERTGAAHTHFKRIGKNELNDNNQPNGAMSAQNIYAAHLGDSAEHTACTGERHKRMTVDHIKAVKNIGMDGYYYGNECEDHFLKFVLWHNSS